MTFDEHKEAAAKEAANRWQITEEEALGILHAMVPEPEEYLSDRETIVCYVDNFPMLRIEHLKRTGTPHPDPLPYRWTPPAESMDYKLYCLDGGICHHECAFAECFRVKNCGPFTAFGERWFREESGEPIPSGECWCGCGSTTKPGSYFLLGHNRTARSAVITVEYGSIPEFLIKHGYGPGGRNPIEELTKARGETLADNYEDALRAARVAKRPTGITIRHGITYQNVVMRGQSANRDLMEELASDLTARGYLVQAHAVRMALAKDKVVC